MYSKYVLCIYNVSRRFGILHVMTFQYIVIYLLECRKMLIFICAVVQLNVSFLALKFHLHLPQEKSQQTQGFNILIFCQYVIALLYITHLQWPFYLMQYQLCSLEKGVKKFKSLFKQFQYQISRSFASKIFLSKNIMSTGFSFLALYQCINFFFKGNKHCDYAVPHLLEIWLVKTG